MRLAAALLTGLLFMTPVTTFAQDGPVARWACADLVFLRSAAARGEKPAQLELGKRYESGLGVPLDFDQARRLYAQASRNTLSRHAAYSGPVGDERRGRVIQFGRQSVTPGLPEAAARLDALNASLPIISRAGETWLVERQSCPQN